MSVQLAQYKEELLNLQKRWANLLSSKVVYDLHVTAAQEMTESLRGMNNRLPCPKWITHSISSDYELNSTSQTEHIIPLSAEKIDEADYPPENLDNDDNQQFSECSAEDVLLADALLEYVATPDEEEDEEARDTSALAYNPTHIKIDRENLVVCHFSFSV